MLSTHLTTQENQAKLRRDLTRFAWLENSIDLETFRIINNNNHNNNNIRHTAHHTPHTTTWQTIMFQQHILKQVNTSPSPAKAQAFLISSGTRAKQRKGQGPRTLAFMAQRERYDTLKTHRSGRITRVRNVQSKTSTASFLPQT